MTPRIIVANLGVRLKSFYRERSAMFFTFAFPVILVLVFGTIFTKPEHLNFDLPVQDNSRSAASARLLEALATGDAFTITPVPAAVDATQYAKEHKLNLLLVIPKDFEALQQAARRRPARRRPGAGRRMCTTRARRRWTPRSSSSTRSWPRPTRRRPAARRRITLVAASILSETLPLHRVLRPRHHRDGDHDLVPVERAQHERGAAPEGHPAQARHDADHARRLARVEHRLPAHPVGRSRPPRSCWSATSCSTSGCTSASGCR